MKPLRGTDIRRFMKNVERPKTQLTFVLVDVEDPVNVGSAFRIADAVHVESLVLAGITPGPPHRIIEKVGRGKDRRVVWKKVDDVETALVALKNDGWFVAAVEVTGDAVAYDEVKWPEKVALVVGHEDHGVPRRVLLHSDIRTFIPMFGKGASLNVHVALAVVAFRVLARGSPKHVQ